tara:strand:+ start:2298 stop:2495 length:198 start_codon:yes stop_codon:yes gene_type:complete
MERQAPQFVARIIRVIDANQVHCVPDPVVEIYMKLENEHVRVIIIKNGVKRFTGSSVINSYANSE